MADYSKMSAEELLREKSKNAAQALELREENRAIDKVLGPKLAERHAERDRAFAAEAEAAEAHSTEVEGATADASAGGNT